MAAGAFLRYPYFSDFTYCKGLYMPTVSLSLHRLLRALAVAATLLAGAAQAVPDAPLQSALARFSAAQGGDRDAIDQAADQFAALLRAEPTHPVLMAYTGAATALRATTTWLPWKKMAYAEDGLALLDKALALPTPANSAAALRGVPVALETRLVAANTFLAVPGFMNRSARGARLLGEVLASPLLAQAPLEFQGAVWLRAAKLAQAENRLDDARRYLDAALAHQVPQASAARAQREALAP